MIRVHLNFNFLLWEIARWISLRSFYLGCFRESSQPWSRIRSRRSSGIVVDGNDVNRDAYSNNVCRGEYVGMCGIDVGNQYRVADFVEATLGRIHGVVSSRVLSSLGEQLLYGCNRFTKYFCDLLLPVSRSSSCFHDTQNFCIVVSINITFCKIPLHEAFKKEEC